MNRAVEKACLIGRRGVREDPSMHTRGETVVDCVVDGVVDRCIQEALKVTRVRTGQDESLAVVEEGRWREKDERYRVDAKRDYGPSKRGSTDRNAWIRRRI